MLLKPGCNPFTAPSNLVVLMLLLTMLLIALQLNGLVDWPWYWLVSPLPIMFLCVCLFFLPIVYSIHRGK